MAELERMSRTEVAPMMSRWRERARRGHEVVIVGINVRLPRAKGGTRDAKLIGSYLIESVTVHGKRRARTLSEISIQNMASRYERVPNVVKHVRYDECEKCNLDRHDCHFCGDALTHSGHDSGGHYHDTAYCRPDLVAHAPGRTCTRPDLPELTKIPGYTPWCYWDHEKNELADTDPSTAIIGYMIDAESEEPK